MSEVPPLHLVLGDEELLVERAVAGVLRSARQQTGADPDTIPVSRMRAGDVSPYELAELLSPSLFADERIVVLEAAGEAGKEAAAMIASACTDIPPGTVLMVLHSAAAGPRRWPPSCSRRAQWCIRARESRSSANASTSSARSSAHCGSKSMRRR